MRTINEHLIKTLRYLTYFLLVLWVITLFVGAAQASEKTYSKKFTHALSVAQTATEEVWQNANAVSAQSQYRFKYCAAVSQHMTIGYLLGSYTVEYEQLTEHNAVAVVNFLIEGHKNIEPVRSTLQTRFIIAAISATKTPNQSVIDFSWSTYRDCLAGFVEGEI